MLSRSVIDITAYFIYCLFVVTLGTIVNKKLYQNVKNEEHLEKGKIIQRILKTHSLLQIFVWPFIISIAFFLKWNKEILDVIPSTYVGYCIVILRSLNTLNSCFDGFNSLIIAISRYSCIVYKETVENIGVRKVRNLLISSSVGIPFIFAILNESLVPVEDIWGALFMPKYTYSHDRLDYNESAVNNATIVHLPQSPLFHIARACLPSWVAYGLKLLWWIILISIHSNLLEGIIYMHIHVYYNRSQNKSLLGKALSEEVKMRRRRRYTISIKMTMISWSLELITGGISLVNTLIFGHDDSLEIVTQVLVGVHVFLYFVVIPSSYLLNTEIFKNRIVEQGWTSAIPREKRSSRIAPLEHEDVEMKRLNNHKNSINKGPIPTISGNVNIETSYKIY